MCLLASPCLWLRQVDNEQALAPYSGGIRLNNLDRPVQHLPKC
jgi:hypothetical protein